MILHITDRESWEQALGAGAYQPPGFAEEGFIHCSTLQQVIAVADRVFRGQAGLVLLCIEPERLKAGLRFENLDGGPDLFPHIYGPLNLDAVTGVLDFPPGPDGLFTLPPALASD